MAPAFCSRDAESPRADPTRRSRVRGGSVRFVIDFALSDDLVALRDRVRAFVDREAVPLEARLRGEPPDQETVAHLRAKARAEGIYGPHLARELGGLGLDWRSVAVVFEAAGRSLLGPLALNGAAPDEGNMHLLHEVASPAQVERYLRPLAAGEIRSCFAMTEPAPGAGSDPAMLRTRARKTSGGWTIDGEKWFITGAEGAAFAICMARTSDDPSGRRGATMFLVDASNPGMRVRRRIGTLDHVTPGGHCAVAFEGCEVAGDAVLGEVDEGFRYAQLRLAPARLTHCMRWLGVATRAQEIAVMRAAQRTAFGKRLGEHQGVAFQLADTEIELHAARLMIWHTAWMLDRGEHARHESSMAKTFVAEAVFRAVDRALQVCGSLGVSDDIPLGAFLRESRPFRIYDGPSEVHRMAIAARLFRRYEASKR
ncbi:acyl-CoA dehydrogenase [bacterium]|nr:MAG: acyl-CoA dehydrogenase [bacterium]